MRTINDASRAEREAIARRVASDVARLEILGDPGAGPCAGYGCSRPVPPVRAYTADGDVFHAGCVPINRAVKEPGYAAGYCGEPFNQILEFDPGRDRQFWLTNYLAGEARRKAENPVETTPWGYTYYQQDKAAALVSDAVDNGGSCDPVIDRAAIRLLSDDDVDDPWEAYLIECDAMPPCNVHGDPECADCTLVDIPRGCWLPDITKEESETL